MSKESKRLLTKELICGALVDLMRATHPSVSRPAQFATIMGTSNAVVAAVLKAKNMPQVDTIEMWTQACGKTVAQFFYDLTLELPADIDVKKGCEDFYRLLTVILESDYAAFVAGIESNLVGLAKAVDPGDPLVQRYSDILLKRKVASKDLRILHKPAEGPTSARASPGKPRRP